MKSIACILCGSENNEMIAIVHDQQLYIDDTSYRLVRCRQCGLVYLNPQPTQEELERYYPPNYPSYVASETVFGKSAVFETLKTLKNLIFGKKVVVPTPVVTHTSSAPETSKTVLDFGCGTGRYLLQMQKDHPSWKLYGSDIGTNETVRAIGEQGNIQILIGPSDLPWRHFPPNTFDIITLWHVLEHLNDPKETLSKLRGLLKEDGEIHIEVPNIETIKFKIFGKNFSNIDAPRHLYHFSPNTLTELCQQSGLNVVHTEITGTTKSTLRSIYNVLGIRSRKLHPLAYACLNVLTKMLGEKRINTEAVRVHCRKETGTNLNFITDRRVS